MVAARNMKRNFDWWGAGYVGGGKEQFTKLTAMSRGSISFPPLASHELQQPVNSRVGILTFSDKKCQNPHPGTTWLVKNIFPRWGKENS